MHNSIEKNKISLCFTVSFRVDNNHKGQLVENGERNWEKPWRGCDGCLYTHICCMTPRDLRRRHTLSITDDPVITSILNTTLPLHCHLSLNLHTCFLIPEPRGTIKTHKCQTQNTQTHAPYVHNGHAWPSPSSPEAEHEKGYLCSLKDPRQLSAHAFTAALMKLVRPHNAAFSASRADLNAADRKPEEKKKKRKQLVSTKTCSWQWGLLLWWSPALRKHVNLSTN